VSGLVRDQREKLIQEVSSTFSGKLNILFIALALHPYKFIQRDGSRH